MIMAVFSLLPAIGPAIVWVPAVVILMISGEVLKGFILLAGGTLIIGLIDNVLRPILVGRDTKMPDFLILLSTIGGLAVFGISGFVIGPIIAALFLAFWEIFGEVYVGEEKLGSRIEPGRPTTEENNNGYGRQNDG
jgi:predicted PurR-regulated permease PerM